MTRPVWIKHAAQLATLAQQVKDHESKEAMTELSDYRRR